MDSELKPNVLRAQARRLRQRANERGTAIVSADLISLAALYEELADHIESMEWDGNCRAADLSGLAPITPTPGPGE
jgi:hypothetical protein